MNEDKNMNAHSLPEAVLAILGEGSALVLATMIDQNGSVPRKAGARMLVRPNGEIWGTVGGGRYEGNVINLARQLLHENASATVPEAHEGSPGVVVTYFLRESTDMGVNHGWVTLLLEVVPPDARSRQIFKAALEAGKNFQPFVFITSFVRHEEMQALEPISPCEGEAPGKADTACAVTVQRHLYLQEEQAVVPDETRNLPSYLLATAGSLTDTTPCHMVQDGKDYLLELYERPFRTIIFGGGHVAQGLAQLAKGVDFPVAVVDDRSKFANIENFPGSEILVPESLSEDDAAVCMHALRVGPHDAIVIATRGHAHDRDVLVASLRTNAGYIGMIGSESKRAAVYNSMGNKGFSQERIDFVHSPIGLPIGASSPQEIAVSIVAELIQWRKKTRNAATGKAS
jgi:Xanthine and CO dehydrogenases maturation factor, XdhC/CoxF family